MITVKRAAVAASASTALALGGLWFGTGHALADAADPPSVAQLCAATGDESLDALLKGVAATDLVGSLAPLASLTVPDSDGLTLKSDVTLSQVRTALNCTSSTTPTSTTEPTTVPPTSTTSPVYGDVKDCSDFADRESAQTYYNSVTTPANPDPSHLDADGDGIACEPNERRVDPRADDGSTAATDGSQVITVPRGSASTGEA